MLSPGVAGYAAITRAKLPLGAGVHPDMRFELAIAALAGLTAANAVAATRAPLEAVKVAEDDWFASS